MYTWIHKFIYLRLKWYILVKFVNCYYQFYERDNICYNIMINYELPADHRRQLVLINNINLCVCDINIKFEYTQYVCFGNNDIVCAPNAIYLFDKRFIVAQLPSAHKILLSSLDEIIVRNICIDKYMFMSYRHLWWRVNDLVKNILYTWPEILQCTVVIYE